MKIFTNKSIWKKIAIILVIVILFEAIVTSPVRASDDDVLEGGGKLLSPIFSLLVTTSDGVMNILHSSIMGVEESLIEVDTDSPWWGTLKTIIAVIVTAACIIGAIILSGGIATVLAWTAVLSIGSTFLFGSNFIVALENQAGQAVMSMFDEESLPSTLYLPVYSYSPEEIFKGNILLFNVNFFRNPITIQEKTKIDEDGKEVINYYYYEDENKNEVVTSKQDSAIILQETISNWYNAIRNICLVLMLSVLVYIGIRMLLSSVASEKAKYTTMLKDWFVGLCLLFLMHYIMAFSVTIVEKITNVVSTSLDDNKYIAVIPHTNQIEEDLEELGMEEELRVSPDDATQGYAWPSNLMGYLRLKAQLNTNGWKYIGEAIMFLMLTIFTVMFTYTYLKRLLYMAFLTLIAPIVALTYCIDKLNDGQAQGFNKWLKEYIFNLLIQPMHLLLYYILITSSFEFMGENIIYSIVAIGFMIPAEKLLRSLFGFEKAHTAPAIGPAGAMAASTALNHLLHKGGKGKGEGRNGNSRGENSDSDRVPMPRETNPVEAFLDEGNENDEGQRDFALDKYKAEGDGQNANGEYYDSHKDASYAQQEGNKDLEQDEDGERQTKGNKPLNQEQTQKVKTGKQTKLLETTGKKRKIGRAIGRKAHAYTAVGRAAIRKGTKNLPKRAIRMAGRMVTGTAVGALAGGAGIAIGAATGDFSNVVKIGGGSAVSGFALGSGMVKDGHIKEEYRDIYREAYNSSKYKPEAMLDYVKEYKKDENNRRYFEQKFSKEETKEMFKKEGLIEQCLNNDITDKKEMAAIYKLKRDNVVKDYEQGIAVSQLGKMIGGDPERMKGKDKKEWGETISNMARKSGVKDTKKFTEERFKQIHQLYELKK